MTTNVTQDTKTASSWRRRWLAPIFGLMMLAPLLAACGGDSSSPGVASIDATPTATTDESTSDEGSEPTESDEPNDTSEAPEDGELSELAYSQCMRDNGIANFPDPGPNGELTLNANDLDVDPGSPQFTAADEACKKFLPNGGEQQPLAPEVHEALLEYSQCMRDHGIANFPDPTADGGIAIDGDAVDMDSPQFAAAEEACMEHMPGGGEGGGTNQSGGSE